MIFVWELGTPKHGFMKALLWSDEDGFTMGQKEFEIVAGKIRINLPKTCAAVLKYSEESITRRQADGISGL